jgi:hypothetical protein
MMKPTSEQVGHTTNVTIEIPAVVYDNPCVGEPVALHGSLHLVLTVGSDKAGGFHIGNHLNASYAGTGLESGVPYRASDNKQDVWNTRQLPDSHTITMMTRLISQGGVDNASLFTTITTTIDANGVPTATVDNQRVECRG